MSTLLITVGTTEFDELIQAIDNTEFMECLERCHFTKLSIQRGRGTYDPVNILSYRSGLTSQKVEVEIFSYKSNLDKDMQNADLIVSHCGAGSILESISLRKPLIVVINESLQDNHQKELSDALTEGGYCLAAKPHEVIHAVHRHYERPLNDGITKQFPINDCSLFSTIMDSMFDFEQ